MIDIIQKEVGVKSLRKEEMENEAVKQKKQDSREMYKFAREIKDVLVC